MQRKHKEVAGVFIPGNRVMDIMYKELAYVYDELMSSVDYPGWVDYLEDLITESHVNPGNILELACGTGNITHIFANRGYSITGVDISGDMLSVARGKIKGKKGNPRFFLQDMRFLDLDEQFDIVMCTCDGINYLLTKEDVINTFAAVKRRLKEGGLFIFDISSEFKISQLLSRNVFAENFDNSSYIWENHYDEDSKLCRIDLTLFIKRGDLYEKMEEGHFQKAYGEDEIIGYLQEVSFTHIKSYDAFTKNSVQEDSDRIFFVCRKQGDSSFTS